MSQAPEGSALAETAPQASIHTSESQAETSELEPCKYEPETPSGGEAPPNQLSRAPTLLERIQSRVSFFNGSLSSERRQLCKKFVLTYLLMATLILAIFSIYWGASYNRASRYTNLKMLVVLEDTETIDGVEPVFGNTMVQLLQSEPLKSRGGWDIQNVTEFNKVAQEHNNTIRDEVIRQVHHQLYWAAIYIVPNATYNYRNAVLSDDQSFNISTLVQAIYETGRDIMNVPAYIAPQITLAQTVWLQQQANMTGQIFNSSSSFGFNQIQKVSSPISFWIQDRIPNTNAVLVAPSQVGLIYIIIITFFQVGMFGDIHQQVARFNLKHHHYVFYRILSSYFSYMVLSLFYSLVTLAFQVDLTVAFGRAGFLVYWMCSYITMIAVGLMNEVMALLLILLYPPLLGFWLLFWVIANISPTFSPIALCAKFYRYGYAMPVHNSYELTKVIFFDTYKGQVGRNVGIIFAWIVFATISFSFLLKPFMMTMKKRAIAAAMSEAKKAQQEQEEKESGPQEA